jgi:hypothetical protein
MTSKKYIILPTIILVLVILLAACSSNKEPAAAAIKTAEDAFKASRIEAEKFVPDQVKSVEDAIKAAKASFEKGNFDEALTTAKAIPDKVKEMNASVAARKENLAKNWAELSGGVQEMLDAIKSRLDSLRTVKKPPKPSDKARIQEAEEHYGIAVMMWDEAKMYYAAGNTTDVADVSGIAKDEALQAMKLLDMQAPEAAKK